jgi:hypothetical protein
MASEGYFIEKKILGNILKITIGHSIRISLWQSIAVRTPLFRHGFHLSYNQLVPFAKKSNKWNIDLNAALYEELLAKITTGVC